MKKIIFMLNFLFWFLTISVFAQTQEGIRAEKVADKETLKNLQFTEQLTVVRVEGAKPKSESATQMGVEMTRTSVSGHNVNNTPANNMEFKNENLQRIVLPEIKKE